MKIIVTIAACLLTGLSVPTRAGSIEERVAAIAKELFATRTPAPAT
jgi:hypothetical protein